MAELYGIPLEMYYALSVVLLSMGLYFSMTRPKRYIEYTLITTMVSPLPSLIALYVQIGYTPPFYLTLIGYSIMVLSVSLPIASGEFPEFARTLYADTRRYYLMWLSKTGTLEYIDSEKFSRQLTIYTYLLILFSPIIALPLYALGLYIYGFLILIGAAVFIILLPYLSVIVIRSSYMSNLLDELPQVLQLFLIHHRAGETIFEVFENISKAGENLPAWSKLTRSLLLQAEMTGEGIAKVIANWIERGAAPEKIKNFLEGYLYTWIAGGNIEAFVERWLEDEGQVWISRIRSYYERMLVFAEIAIMAAVSPIAVLLIAFLNPAFGTILMEMLIIIFPIALYIIPSIYMTSVRPRMATRENFIPDLKIALIAIGVGIIPVILLSDNNLKIIGFLMAFMGILFPFEIRWKKRLTTLENGVLRWLETSMHYMLAGSMPLDAINKAKSMIKTPLVSRLINQLTYNIETGKKSISTPTPFLTHTLHVIATGISTGSLSPDLLYMNVNILYKIKNTIDESRRSVYPALMLGVLIPYVVLLTMGIGVWFINTISVINPQQTNIPMPFPVLTINLDVLLPLLSLFAIILSLTIGAIISSTHSNYFYSTLIHFPIILSLFVALFFGANYFITMITEYFGF